MYNLPNEIIVEILYYCIKDKNVEHNVYKYDFLILENIALTNKVIFNKINLLKNNFTRVFINNSIYKSANVHNTPDFIKHINYNLFKKISIKYPNIISMMISLRKYDAKNQDHLYILNDELSNLYKFDKDIYSNVFQNYFNWNTCYVDEYVDLDSEAEYSDNDEE
ncbi:MAG: hypothetical protein ACRCZI_02140, partial [Cetobacterium sp.]